jgi:hypothetical protein
MTDPDNAREYTAAEVRGYNPKLCPDCGQRTLHFEFSDVTSFGEEPVYVRGGGECRNPACPSKRAI